MPLTLAEGSLFRVEFLMGKASRTGQEILLLVFNLLSLGVAVILDAQLTDLVIGSWARGVEASTVLATPLYIPQTVMVVGRSEEHTSELQSLMRISYAVFCLKKKTTK